VISTEIASVVARFFADGKGPTHDELTMYFRMTGLSAADPGTKTADGTPIGKLKRVRRVLNHAIDHDPDAGGRLVQLLVDSVRANGGFREGTDGFVGAEVMDQARRGFASIGYEFDAEGHVRQAMLENLQGADLTEALWAYVRRARSGGSDAAHVVGTVKDLSEAIARHVLQETVGGYSKGMNFPGTLYQAYDRLGLRPPPPAMLDQLDEDARIAAQQALYLLACAVNKLRNQQGTGHGRPEPSRLSALDGRISAQASGLIGELLLTALQGDHPSLVGATPQARDGKPIGTGGGAPP
jgi:hypothetical protein